MLLRLIESIFKILETFGNIFNILQRPFCGCWKVFVYYSNIWIFPQHDIGILFFERFPAPVHIHFLPCACVWCATFGAVQLCDVHYRYTASTSTRWHFAFDAICICSV